MLTATKGSQRRACRVLRVARSSLSRTERPTTERATKPLNADLVQAVKAVIDRYPTFGYRRVTAILRRDGMTVNRKAVYRVLSRQGWFVHQRIRTPRPRAKSRRSRTTQSCERWAVDVTHVPCGKDGWAHLCAVIDCYDREIVGYEFALRGRAREAERALEDACLNRFGVVRATGSTRPLIRSDNGLIFQSKRFRAACRAYGLDQEFITPYTPEQNGMIERFFRSLKEECVWLQNFSGFEEARRVIEDWIEWYNTGRPHQSLGDLSPREYRALRGSAA